MTGERMQLEVEERERLGSAESRRLRKQGLIPGILYGRGNDPTPICIPERSLRRVLTGGAGMNAILDVVVSNKGKSHPSVLKDYQQDPIRGTLTHVDLQEVRLDQPIQTTVTLTLEGEAHGSREGGVLTQVLREAHIEALPMEIPDHVEVDVSALGVGDSLRVADIPSVEGITFLDDPDSVVASVTLPTRVEEPEEMLEEGEEVEGMPEDGEQAAEGGSEAPADAGGDAAGDPGTVEG